MKPANEIPQKEREKQYKKALKSDFDRLEYRTQQKIRLRKMEKCWLNRVLYVWKSKFFFSDLYEINHRLKEQIYI